MTILNTNLSSVALAAATALLTLSGCADPGADQPLDSTLSREPSWRTDAAGTVNLDTFNVAGAGGSESAEELGAPPHELDEAAMHDLALAGHDLSGAQIDVDFADLQEEVHLIKRSDVPPAVLAELDRASIIPKSIVGTDERAPVANTRVSPYKTVVKLFTKYVKGGTTWGCSGTMIGPEAVLTAAHCVFNSNRASPGYAYSVTVVPALYLKSLRPSSGVRYEAPFGTSTGAKLFVPQRYIDNEADKWNKIPHDYAVVRLKSSLGNAGVKPFGVMPTPLNKVARLVGYHGDKEGGMRMYSSADRVRKVLANGTFNHYMDSERGSSGSGITGSGGWEDKVFGVNSSEVEGATPYNIAATITNNNYRVLVDWAVRPL